MLLDTSLSSIVDTYSRLANMCSFVGWGGAMTFTDNDLENERRSVAMLSPGQPVSMGREHVLALIQELQEHRATASSL
jgi:hypothetical protein